MAIKTFKEILDNKGYRIDSNDRKIFEQGNLQSFFGFGENDCIEFVIYDINDNVLPQQNNEYVKYIKLSNENIRDYFLIAEGTLLQKYQLPSEYFIDAERLLRESGYNNGIFKTQITLLNKRVGTEAENDKMWISEISPSRTEIRLYPIRNGDNVNKELEERFNLFIQNGEFRDDTINLALNFVEKITPQGISSFIKSKYTNSWYNKMKAEFKISDFDSFVNKIHQKFVESCINEFTHRESDVTSNNYGKPKTIKPSVSLSKIQIRDLCKRLLVNCINFYLLKPDTHLTATFDNSVNESMDDVGRILQTLESNTTVDTSSPIIVKATTPKAYQTDKELAFAKIITKETTTTKAPEETTTTTTTMGPGGGSTLCYTYVNNTGEIWVGDYTDCNGNGVYSAEVQPYSSFCAIRGTAMSFRGMSLIESGICGTEAPPPPPPASSGGSGTSGPGGGGNAGGGGGNAGGGGGNYWDMTGGKLIAGDRSRNMEFE
jgi:hypothetical protein